MILKRFFDEGLAHASYLVSCPATGKAIVIDPNRNFEQYLRAAAGEGVKIAGVAETHIHADYLSGTKELADRAEASLYVSDEGDADWKYAFANDPNVRQLKDGDRIDVGSVRLTAVHTPGHTPEHISYLLTDTSKGEEPEAAFTGDFIFVGDVGRPDLLESAAGIEGASEPAARSLYRSIRKFRSFSESLILWPAHGAGSACGKALGSAPNTTLGKELAHNWAFRIEAEEPFVRAVLEGQPDPPPYFARMKRLNKTDPSPAHVRTGLTKFVSPPIEAFVLDVRFDEEYEEAHLAGSLHVGSYQPFVGYAGWVVPYDVPILLVASNEDQAGLAALSLSLIGIDAVVGWMGPEAIVNAPKARVRSTQTTTSDRLPGEGLILDVRSASEWSLGHIEGSMNIPFGRLDERAGELPRDRVIAVHCTSGARSAVAASILERAGFEYVVDVIDGYAGYVEKKRMAVR